MSTLTPRLQLKRNDGSDPFLRQDFVDNWNKIDAAPGVHICTSTSRPNWGASQAGRRIIETNTRAEYVWTGTAWRSVLDAGSAWVLGVAPGVWLSKGSSTVYNAGSITTSRPGTLLIETFAVVASLDTLAQSVSLQNYVNGSVATDITGFKQWTGSNNNASSNAYDNILTKGTRAVAPGTHTIGVRVVAGTISNASVYAYRIGVTVHLVNTTDR